MLPSRYRYSRESGNPMAKIASIVAGVFMLWYPDFDFRRSDGPTNSIFDNPDRLSNYPSHWRVRSKIPELEADGYQNTSYEYGH